MTNKKLPSDYYPEDYKPMQLPAWAKRIFPIKDIRITQLLLAALVITQVPAFWDRATSHKSYDYAMRACQSWEYRGGNRDRKCYSRGDKNSRVITGAEGYKPLKTFHYQ